MYFSISMPLLSWPVVLVLSKLQRSPLSKEILNGQFNQSTKLLETMFPQKAAGGRGLLLLNHVDKVTWLLLTWKGRC